MNALAFALITVLMLAAGLAAATLRKLIHAALMFALANVGLAAFFFLLGAEFVGLVQIFVYVGAVAILIVFTILLTRREGESTGRLQLGGMLVAMAVFAALAWSIFHTPALAAHAPAAESLSVRQIGEALMTTYAWPLLCMGVLLTAALIGALVLVMEEKP
jgi:NADH-quinone oxidoreductase subunit J